jgi:hypothetical protein
MIPVEQKREVLSSGIERSASFEISDKDAAHIMTILRDTLYSDKIMAVLREYAANAWDANRMAGRGDRPIEVTLPTYEDPTLRIKDNGPGLSFEDVFEVYNRYGASTKRDSNAAVGMLGIGSKSGFAYSDAFTIVSYHGGQKATYVAVIDDSEKGRVDLFDVQEQPCACGDDHTANHRHPTCPEPHTGVEIQIPVKPDDIPEFRKKACVLFAYFDPQPQINVDLLEIPSGKDFPGLGRVFDSADTGSPRLKGEWTVVMGCIPYKVNLQQLTGLSPSVRKLNGLLRFDIGTLQVAASREELKYGDITKAALTARLNELIDRYIEHLLEGINELDPWQRRLRLREISRMQLTLPDELNKLANPSVELDNSLRSILRFKRADYSGKFVGTSFNICVDKHTRLVFRDEKRAIHGYSLKNEDIVVDPLVDKPTARKKLGEQLVTHGLVGIPVINISTIPWVRPATTSKPMDPARAKAQCLILKPQAISASPKSERWDPVDRTPQDTDVYVVLDSFAVPNFEEFYTAYENDRILLESAGGKMPEIIGYRNTKAHPVDRLKLKGVDYKLWRDDGFVKQLMALPGVAKAVEAKIWGGMHTFNLSQKVIERYGVDHPIGKHLRRVLSAQSEYVKLDRKYYRIIDRIVDSIKENEARAEWEKIIQAYPLFQINGHHLHFLCGECADRWHEYVLMVDSLRSIRQSQEQKG